MKRVLDLGCGRERHIGSIGIDINLASSADEIGDLDHVPYPFAENTFDEIRCDSIIEHLGDVMAAMAEIHRIARPRAIVTIIAPHFSSVDAFTDPTHRHFFSTRSLDYVTGDFPEYSDYEIGVKSRKLDVRVEFWPLPRLGGIQPQSWLGAGLLANRYPSLYERFFAFLLPARELVFQLEVVN